VTRVSTSISGSNAAGYPLRARAAESAETALLRPHIVAALQAMLDHAELSTIDATRTENGVTVMLEEGNVRCVLVVSPQAPRHSLSPRELQIVRLVADGATNRAIASSLDISLWTVSTHMRRIFAKLGVYSRAEMVAQFFGGRDNR
jgi:DNA-binding CsgD family transcriptional regulator